MEQGGSISDSWWYVMDDIVVHSKKKTSRCVVPALEVIDNIVERKMNGKAMRTCVLL